MRTVRVVGLRIAALPLLCITGCGGGGLGGSALTGTLTGTVELKTEGGAVHSQPTIAPLAGAMVKVEPVGGGAALASVTSGTTGSFSIVLAAGSYRIATQPPANRAGVLAPAPQTIDLQAGQTIALTPTFVLLAP